jgi:RNA polymerase sigma-70 factor (ECF subfamily)
MIFSDRQAEERFAAMIREHLSMFRGLSRRILRVPADVDDAVQNALLKAWRRRGSFREEVKLAHWVARIVINESYELLRKRYRERAGLAEYSREEAADPACQEAQLRRLEDAIAELPQLYRQTVHIALLSGFDSETAARMLECTPNTLYQRIHKAKELLRRRLCHEQSGTE